jgi:hypothetical protein
MKTTTVEEFLKEFNRMYDVVCHEPKCLNNEMIYCMADPDNTTPNFPKTCNKFTCSHLSKV